MLDHGNCKMNFWREKKQQTLVTTDDIAVFLFSFFKLFRTDCDRSSLEWNKANRLAQIKHKNIVALFIGCLCKF